MCPIEHFQANNTVYDLTSLIQTEGMRWTGHEVLLRREEHLIVLQSANQIYLQSKYDTTYLTQNLSNPVHFKQPQIASNIKRTRTYLKIYYTSYLHPTIKSFNQEYNPPSNTIQNRTQLKPSQSSNTQHPFKSFNLDSEIPSYPRTQSLVIKIFLKSSDTYTTNLSLKGVRDIHAFGVYLHEDRLGPGIEKTLFAVKKQGPGSTSTPQNHVHPIQIPAQ
ncbi:hypothetical protein E6O75_ATG03913 [Venturia nashicola]|uniref:Uncharacterized protein n=1 Tax=Venturia nashicola TaxID=86259 RepID=A0A4Z1PQ43_9PEZI|nr:hypothetical protein E6O75_ATG03913 [Venturia nashicola]